jgi:hypothetical protein
VPLDLREIAGGNRWGRPEEAIPEYETTIAFNRNFVSALFGLRLCKLHVGSIEEVIPLEKGNAGGVRPSLLTPDIAVPCSGEPITRS